MGAAGLIPFGCNGIASTRAVDTGMERRIQWPNGILPGPHELEVRGGRRWMGQCRIGSLLCRRVQCRTLQQRYAECLHGRQRQFGHPSYKDTEWNVDVHADENRGFVAV